MPFNEEKPEEGSDLISAEFRQNWEAITRAIGGVNLIADPIPLIWAAGDVAAPAHYTTSGTGHAVARETTITKMGGMSLKLTSGAAAVGYATQTLLDTAAYSDIFDGLNISFGAYIYATASSEVRLYFTDGVDTTYSSYHTGGSSWVWHRLTHAINASATKLECGLYVVAGSKVGYMTGLTAVLGSVKPNCYQPPPCNYGTIKFPLLGELNETGGPAANGTQQGIHIFARPALVKYTQLRAYSAPVGSACDIDVNHWDGSAWQSIYGATKVQIANGASPPMGGLAPDGTYRYRCFTGYAGTGQPTDAMLSIDVDEQGSTTAAQYVDVHVRCLQYARPLENFLAHDDL